MPDNQIDIVIASKQIGAEAFDRAGAQVDKLTDQVAKSGQAMGSTGKSSSDLAQKWMENRVGVEGLSDKLSAHLGLQHDTASAISGTIEKLSGGSAAVMGFATGLLAAGAAAAEFVSHTMETAHHLEQMSASTGISVEALSLLRGAAKIVGADVDALGNATFQIMKRMGEDSGQFAEGLGKIGLKMSDLKGLRPEEILLKINEGLRNTADASTRMVAGTELMGRGFRESAFMMSQDLGELTRQAKDAGVQMDGPTLEAAERLEHAWNTLKLNAEGLALTIGGDLIQALDKFWNHPMTQKGERGGKPLPGFGDTKIVGSTIPGIDLSHVASTADAQAYVKSLATDYATLTPTQKALALETEKLGGSLEVLAKKFGVSGTALKKYTEDVKQGAEEAKKHTKEWQDILGNIAKIEAGGGKSAAQALEEIIKSGHESSVKAEEYWARPFIAASDSIDQAYARTHDAVTGESKALESLWKDNGASTDEWMKKYLETLKKQEEFNNTYGTRIKDNSKDFSKMATDALDTVSGVLSGITNKLAQTVTVVARGVSGMIKSIGSGDVWGAISSGVGTVIGLFEQLGKQDEIQTNRTRDAFFAAHGGYIALHQSLIDAGNEAAFYEMWTAKSTDQWSKALTDVNAALDKQQTKLTNIANLNQQISGAQSQIDQLMASSIPTWDQVSAIATKYGVDISKAGLAVQQLAENASAKDILNDWKVWSNAGGDLNAMISGMSGNISKLVQDAMAFGTTLPENMKGLVQLIADNGLLVDKSGKTIKDLNGLTWGAAVETDVDKNTNAIQALTNSIDDWNAQIAALTNSPAFTSTLAGTGGSAGNSSRGFASGGYGDFGSGTPAMLHGLEAIVPLNAPTSSWPMPVVQRMQSGGRSGGPVTVVLQATVDRRVLSEVVFNDLPFVWQDKGVTR